MVPYFKLQDQVSAAHRPVKPTLFGFKHFNRASCIVTLRAGGDEEFPSAEVKPPQFVEVATIVLKPAIKDPISTVSAQPQAPPDPLLEPKTVKASIKEKPKKPEKPKPKTKPKAKLPTKHVKSTPFSASPGSDSRMTPASR